MGHRFIHNKTIWSGGIGMILFLACAFLVDYLTSPLSFDSTPWKAESHPSSYCSMRYRMVDDLIHILHETSPTREQVVEMLGAPPGIPAPLSPKQTPLRYQLGGGVVTYYLSIHFDETGRVVQASCNPD